MMAPSTCEKPNHTTDRGRNTSGAVIAITSTARAAVVKPSRRVAAWAMRRSRTIARPVSRLRSRGVEESVTSRDSSASATAAAGLRTRLPLGLDAYLARASRLAVEHHFDVVFAGREPARILDVEFGGGGALIGHLLFRFADDAPLVRELHADRRRTRALGQHGDVDGVVRLERRGERADAPVRVEGAAGLDAREREGAAACHRADG